MLTPGAERSGLSQLSPVRGPNDEKSASALNVGLAMLSGSSVSDPPSAARRATPFGDVEGLAPPGTPRNGIVTVNCSPVSGLLVILPSNGGKPA